MTPVMDIIRDVAPEALEDDASEQVVEMGLSNTEGTEKDHEKSGMVSQEMMELATQIKEQLRLLIDNGMRQQALEVLQQVKKMLPGDEELEQLERELLAE